MRCRIFVVGKMACADGGGLACGMWHWAWYGIGHVDMWCWAWYGVGQVDILQMGGGGMCTGEYHVTLRIGDCDV